MGASDRYCLRWNNHQTNFISVMDDLLKNQTLTDVTLGVEDGRFLKCHKIILAICSPYFHSLFIEVPSKNPIILLKDVKYTEIKAILEFMYKGEVSVAYDEMAALLQVAELLQVKGLVAGNDFPSTSEPVTSPTPAVCSTSSNRNGDTAQQNYENFRSNATRRRSSALPFSDDIRATSDHQDIGEAKFSIPAWPMSQIFPTEDQKSTLASLANFHPFLPTQTFPFTQLRDNVSELTSGQKSRNNASGINATRHQDTPILRAVLNPDHEDGSMRSPINRQDSHDSHYRNRSNGSANNEPNERRGSMDLSQSQRAHSSSYETDATMMDEDDKGTTAQKIPDDKKDVSHGTSQKLASKRYKNYTRKDIWNAIAAVKGGLSANKAAELFRVPSRTLYDKIKKLSEPPIKHKRRKTIDAPSSSQHDTTIVGNVSSIGLADISKHTIENNPVTIVETTLNEIHEKSNDPEETKEGSQNSSYSGIYRDNDNENEAEDLSVSRNVRVIVSPSSNVIQDTA